MNQLEDDLHRVLQLARAQARLPFRRGRAAAGRSQLQPSSLRHHAVQRHRHERGDSRERRGQPRATLLNAKLKGISAVYGLERNIPKLSECSARAKQVHADVARAAGGDTDPEAQERALEAKFAARRDLYKRHFSGLREAYGPSGLPKLECLLNAAQAEKKKMARHSALAVGASVLTSGNRIYASCTLESLHDAKFSMCAERAALLKMLGEDPSEVVVAMAICSNDQEVLPSPCGGCREFMAEFGDFPVYLVNAHYESEETRSFALFPRARQSSTAKVHQQQHKQQSMDVQHARRQSGERVVNQPNESPHATPPLKVRDWTCEHVLDWLRDDVELPQYRSIFSRSAVDGCTLLHLEDCDLQLLFGVLQPLHRRRILLHIDRLKDRELLEHGIDYGQLQDYLAMLDRDRIAIVADLKATFDRLDQNKDGFLDFREVRQALSTLHCDASPQVVDALLRGKLLGGDSEAKVSFSDFVAAFSSLAMQPAVGDREAGAPAVWQLPALNLRGLRSTFDKADTNNSGGISEKELAQLFLGLDAAKSKDECARKARQWLEVADSDGDGRLSFAEFLVRYIQLKQIDVGKLRSFFESCEPVESAELKPVGVLKRALETFFVGFSSAEISVWYKHHLNSELLRVVKDGDSSRTVLLAVAAPAEQPSNGDLPASSLPSSSTRTSLTIAYADFVLAVFLFQDHVKDRRQQTRELRAKMSNDALAHKSRVVHLQQSGHVRMCPQSKEAPSASGTSAEHKSLSLAEIRRSQQKQRLQALQNQQERESEDEGKAGSDRDHDSSAVAAKRQKLHLARQLEKVDAAFDRFARAKAAKKRTGASRSYNKKIRATARESDEDEKKCESSSDSDSHERRRAGCDDDASALNAMETAQALTELGISCPRERMLRLLKNEGFGIHDNVERRDFRRLFQHFHTESETTLGQFPSHRRPVSCIWDEEVEHAKRMQEMAALLGGEYGKHPSRQDYDHYLLERRRQTPEGGSRDPSSCALAERKNWSKEVMRVQSSWYAQKHTRSGGTTSRRRSGSSNKRADREESKGESSDSNTSSTGDVDSEKRRSRQIMKQRGRRNDRHHNSRSRSRASRGGRSTRTASKRVRSRRRRHHSSSSSSSAFSSNETTESEREELVREQRRLKSAERRRRGFEIGDRVVSIDDGYGTLIRLHQDYFVADVHFDSRKKAKNVDLSKLKRANPLDEQAALHRRRQHAPNFHVGMRVVVSHKGTKSTREGRIAVCRLDGTFDVFVNKLGERETLKRVPAKHLHALSSKPTVYAVGASVTVKQKHVYLRGKVQVCRVDGSYDICLYQDKSTLKHVEVDLIYPDADDVGDSDDGSDLDHRAAGKKSSSSGKKRVAASDSEGEEKKKADENDEDGGYDDFEPKFAKGDRVEVRFQGKDAFYPGKIARVLTDGTYDIMYDDGDSETRVKSHLIRSLMNGSSSTSQPKPGRPVKDDDYEDDFE